MATDSNPRKISLKEIDKQLQQGLDGTDTARAAALTGLARVRAAKQTGLQRERDRLAKTVPADDPELAALDRRLVLNKALVRQLDSAAGRAATTVPTAMDDRYILHGHVRNAALEPQAGLTVAIYDAGGTWLQQAGYACTDAKGYFLLVVMSDKDRGSTSAGAARTEVLQAAAQTSSRFFVYVLDAKGAILYRDSNPLDFRLGGLDYREIVLGDGGTRSCAPPPGGSGPRPGGNGGSQPPTDKTPAGSRPADATPADSSPSNTKQRGDGTTPAVATVRVAPGADVLQPAKPVAASPETRAVANSVETPPANATTPKRTSTAKKPADKPKPGD